MFVAIIGAVLFPVLSCSRGRTQDYQEALTLALVGAVGGAAVGAYLGWKGQI